MKPQLYFKILYDLYLIENLYVLMFWKGNTQDSKVNVQCDKS